MEQTNTQPEWARPQDWEPLKETIARLYWDQDRPLNEVAEIMRQKHGFHATKKMYKARLKKWGLTKYLKADKVEQVRQEAAEGKIVVPLIRGRLAGPERLKRELRRKLPEEYATLTGMPATRQAMIRSPRIQSQSPPPSIFRLDAPLQFKYVENSLVAVLDYSQNRMQAGIWDRTSDFVSDDYSDSWQNKVLVCNNMMKNGKMKEAFRLLDSCLKGYKRLIKKEHPLLMIETLITHLALSKDRPDLADSILRYISGLCQICLGPAHPYSRLWTSLRCLGIDQVRKSAAVIIKAQMASYETYFAPEAEFMVCQQVDTARQVHCYGYLATAEAERDIARAIKLRESRGLPDTNDFVCWAKEMLAFIYKFNGKYVEALDILGEVGRFVDAGAEGMTDFTVNEYYNVTCIILTEIGTYEEIVSFFRKRLDWNLKVVGSTHHWTLRAVAELDWQYGTRNDVEASAKLHNEFDFESNWDTRCKQEDEKEEGTSSEISQHPPTGISNPPGES
ncbi:uncharacterized protein JN550_013803 [Neoarthrinium moseri]|uniref:uncharacterized protein n=1 Tax=Neoarthrinium moseri TaxID=1658444 RepID=UPI001FDCF5A4|nr:uncharacterized protein JN550_013803 [Neoarthrinium moseri]KAI1856472.1 hypothetical protein JN550_013803 [Neoarthrinium moseri]